MIMNLVLGISTMVVCLFLQSLLLVYVIGYYKRHGNLVNNPSMWASVVVVKGMMLLLLAGNLAQIAIWASLFMFLGEFELFSEAFYHSAVNFSTLGYGDFVMTAKHKLLGPLQAVNGVLMIGVSTSILMAGLNDAIRKTIRAREE
jgi:hypothetical protein